jgi:hypothetical protein
LVDDFCQQLTSRAAFSTMPLVKKALENIYKKNDGKKINKDLLKQASKTYLKQ